MNNQLAFDLSQLEGMSSEQLEVITMSAIQLNVKKILSRVEKIEDDVLKSKTESRLMIEDVKEKIEGVEERTKRTLEVATNSMRVREPREGWVNLTTMGRYFAVSISSRRMGKLLRVIGLAQKNSSTTVPYRQFIGAEKLARVDVFEQGASYKWNFKRVVNHLNLWLEKRGLFEEFYSNASEADMDRFIDDLYYRHIGRYLN